MAGPPAMNLGRRRRRVVRSWILVLAVGLAIGVAGLPAGAVETPAGSKNFTAPGYVPNYFTNETGAFTGAAGARGAASGAPAYAAPRPYARPSYGDATASHGRYHYRERVASRRRYHHPAHGRVQAHRRFVHVAARRGRSLHARPVAALHRAVHSRARSAAGTRRVARAGR